MTQTGVAALDIVLTGGASNRDPDLSLGGEESPVKFRSLAPIIADPIPALRIERVLPCNGEGTGMLTVNLDLTVSWTPPGGVEGLAVAVAEGATEVITGQDVSKGIVVTREAGFEFVPGVSLLNLVYAMNGCLGMSNVTNAQRLAGVTTYRAVMLRALDATVSNLRLWLPPQTGAQAVYSLATEDPATSGAIQTIADETTPPTGLSWSSPTTEGGALVISAIAQGDSLGLWIRRVFPVGTGSVKEDVQLFSKFAAG